MEQNALVVNPWVTDFKLYDEWMHPVGLYFLITLLRNNNYDVHYFNCLRRNLKSRPKKYTTGDFEYREITKPALYAAIPRKYKLYGCTYEEFIRYLQSIDTPDIICVGSQMTYWVEGLEKTVATIKMVFPETPVIIGGIAAQLIPDTIKKRIPGCHIAGPIIRNNSFIHSPFFKLSSFPSPPSMLDGFKALHSVDHAPVLLTLGCPMSCTYCASSLLQPTFQIRPIATVVKEIEYMVNRYGVTDFAFYDDALLVHPEQGILKFIAALQKRNYNLRFHSPNGLHLRFLSDRVLESMKSIGFKTLRFGYESGTVKFRNATSNKTGREELAQQVNRMIRSGFNVKDIGIYIMGGLPEQQPEEMLEELHYVSSLGIKVKPVFISPIPGTSIATIYSKQFPDINKNPLWHNDTFFITKVGGWNFDAVEEIRKTARVLNNHIS